MAPIEIARIDTERSFYQLKDSVQEMVRGVIEAYWSLVYARTDLWARRQQVKQGTEAFKRAEANLQAGLGDMADVAQARSSLANFRASLITAEAAVFAPGGNTAEHLGAPTVGASASGAPRRHPPKNGLMSSGTRLSTWRPSNAPTLVQL